MRDFREKGKQIGRTLLFWGLLLLLLRGLSGRLLALSMEDDRLTKSRNKSVVGIQKEPSDTIDVLILGDSLSYCSFSPMQLWKDYGVTAYVCGQSGQKIQESYYMLKTALKSQKPKLVVLETHTILNGQKCLEGLQTTLEEIGNYYFPAIRFHDVWKDRVKELHYEEALYKGFPLYEKIRPYEGGEYMQHSEVRRPLNGMVTCYLDKIVRLCQEQQMELWLVSTPSPKNYDYTTYNALRDYAKEQGLNYMDMNLYWKRLGIDWKMDTMDRGDHLNLAGARKTTACLGRWLEADGKLPDHRKDVQYESWKREAEKYERNVQEKLKIMQEKE